MDHVQLRDAMMLAVIIEAMLMMRDLVNGEW